MASQTIVSDNDITGELLLIKEARLIASSSPSPHQPSYGVLQQVSLLLREQCLPSELVAVIISYSLSYGQLAASFEYRQSQLILSTITPLLGDNADSKNSKYGSSDHSTDRLTLAMLPNWTNNRYIFKRAPLPSLIKQYARYAFICWESSIKYAGVRLDSRDDIFGVMDNNYNDSVRYAHYKIGLYHLYGLHATSVNHAQAHANMLRALHWSDSSPIDYSLPSWQHGIAAPAGHCNGTGRHVYHSTTCTTRPIDGTTPCTDGHPEPWWYGDALISLIYASPQRHDRSSQYHIWRVHCNYQLMARSYQFSPPPCAPTISPYAYRDIPASFIQADQVSARDDWLRLWDPTAHHKLKYDDVHSHDRIYHRALSPSSGGSSKSAVDDNYHYPFMSASVMVTLARSQSYGGSEYPSVRAVASRVRDLHHIYTGMMVRVYTTLPTHAPSLSEHQRTQAMQLAQVERSYYRATSGLVTLASMCFMQPSSSSSSSDGTATRQLQPYVTDIIIEWMQQHAAREQNRYRTAVSEGTSRLAWNHPANDWINHPERMIDHDEIVTPASPHDVIATPSSLSWTINPSSLSSLSRHEQSSIALTYVTSLLRSLQQWQRIGDLYHRYYHNRTRQLYVIAWLYGRHDVRRQLSRLRYPARPSSSSSSLSPVSSSSSYTMTPEPYSAARRRETAGLPKRPSRPHGTRRGRRAAVR